MSISGFLILLEIISCVKSLSPIRFVTFFLTPKIHNILDLDLYYITILLFILYYYMSKKYLPILYCNLLLGHMSIKDEKYLCSICKIDEYQRESLTEYKLCTL